MRSGLSREEDRELRRLHFFRGFGSIATGVAQRYADLRERDRRTKIREPEEALPITKPRVGN